MKNRKVLLIASYNRSILLFRKDLLIELKNRGDEVMAIAPDDDPSVGEELRKLGIAYQSIPLSRNGFNPVMDLIFLARLVKVIARFRPDVVVPYTIKPVIYGSLASRFFRTVSAFPMITGLGYLETETGRLGKRMVRKAIFFLYRSSLSRVKGIIFQNTDDEAYFFQHKLVPANIPSVVVSGSGVNLQRYSQTAAVISPVKFLLIARLLKSKGVSLYVEAAAALKEKYPTTEFHLIGQFDEKNPDGIDKQWLMERVGRGDVIFHGFQNDVRDVLSKASVFVLPSHYREGVPRTILEALAMGKPVITTDHVGCRETVSNNLNGFLIPVKNTAALITAMESLITDTSLIERMGKASHQLAIEKFDVNKVNEHIIGFINCHSK